MTTPEPRPPLTAAELAEMRHGARWVDIGVCVDAVPRLADELERCRALLSLTLRVIDQSTGIRSDDGSIVIPEIVTANARAYLWAAEGGSGEEG